MGLKLDMANAYDRMGWDFILQTLNAFGFHKYFISLVKECISSILLNGSPFEKITSTRGLRQGDPLSPFLFILGIEVLPRMLLRAENEIAKEAPSISHLLFADDSFIFCRLNLEEAREV